MNLKRVLYALSFVMLLANAVSAQEKESSRAKYNFNSSWLFHKEDVQDAGKVAFDDAAWKKISLPHIWNEDEAFKKRIDSLSTGVVWYRKHFKIPASEKNKKVFIEFEGIRFGGDFYLNGKLLGTHGNGVMAFGFDLTDILNPNGDNVIAVRVDNAWNYHEKSTGSTFQWNDRNFYANYGGINKNVWLHFTDKLYQTLPLYSFLKTTGTYIYAKNIDVKNASADITVESQVKNENNAPKTLVFETEIKDLNGKLVKKIAAAAVTLAAGEMKIVKVSSNIKGLNFWSWGYGYLYDVYTTLKVDGKAVDVVKTRTGFRKTAFKDGMIYLNDAAIMMHGYAQRTTNEWPAVGSAVPAWMSDYSNKMMVESGGNLIRWMHVTPWKQDVESCDRVGIIQAMPAGDAEKDTDGRRWELRLELMRDAIIYNRNNPSIIFYEGGNESISAEHMKQLKAIRDQYDPYGGRATGSREMLDVPEAEYGGEMLYINKSGTKPVWAMEYARDEALRKYWDENTFPYHKSGFGPLYKGADASDYNKNQDAFARDAVSQWYDYWSVRPGTGKRVSSGGTTIMFSDSQTFTRGAENYRRSGKTDALRIPKDAFYAHQVMWDGWVDPNPKGLHIIGHWNYKEGTKKNVDVVSAGEKVQLFLNGKSLGYGQRNKNFLFTFPNISWEAGTLKAISYDTPGKQLSEKELVTAGEAVALRLKTIQHPEGFHADGADLALVEVEVIDAKGQRCPTALNKIDFTLDGPAEWRGGLAQGPDNYILAKSLPVESGVNRVIIRSTTEAGKITLTAKSEGLQSTSVSWDSAPVKVMDGLTNFFPSQGLSVNLERGASPVAPTYKVLRKSVSVIKAEAGANSEKAMASCDDNELSAWVNDGKTTTAWVKYDFDKVYPISEIDLKLNNFRSKVYPLIIMVDDKVVFNGPSKTGLGYFNIAFKPVVGKSVTIKLGTKTVEQKGVDIGVEVTGKRLDDGVAQDDRKAKGTLSIIEADIYSK